MKKLLGLLESNISLLKENIDGLKAIVDEMIIIEQLKKGPNSYGEIIEDWKVLPHGGAIKSKKTTGKFERY